MEKQGPRILLVDDEEPVRLVLDVVLRPAGYGGVSGRERRRGVAKIPVDTA